MLRKFLCLVPLLLTLAAGDIRYGSEAQADEVSWDSLPGAERLDTLKGKFRMFAGYLPIKDEGSASMRNMFYWYFESQGSPEEDPLLLWTNGGPGCSGMLGLLTEHGPFLVRAGGQTLEANPFSWNLHANMLYVEQPCGVGFSYSDDIAAYTTGDARAAQDNVALIRTFLDRYPHLRASELHLSSESYGGHYLPTLAASLVDANAAARANGSDAINFKGLLVGNPYTDWGSNQVAMYGKYWGEQLISKPLYDEWNDKCVKDGYRGDSPKCQSLELEMDSQLGGLNPYALDFPTCSIAGATSPQGERLRQHVSAKRAEATGHSPEFKGKLADAPAPYEPCAQSYIVTYLNRPEVKAALHAKPTIRWQQCSNKVEYSQDDVRAPMMPYYTKLFAASPDTRILVFSGDDDAVCATSGTQWWVYDLGHKAVSLWRPWKVDGQVAGYATLFDSGLAFVTVHSAGHEVPAYQPARALALLQRYLDGTWFAPPAAATAVV
eukprot:TRINITY_DN627_c0_g3_i1.p1 TRINITY_DN627_c0_g3~~TRINITY_DN627_c0_g3_i1.p1  ORF type:complete len:544 (-),score=164.92 TRINITY_DN627_c0_g3_i1:674-2152(-)